MVTERIVAKSSFSNPHGLPFVCISWADAWCDATEAVALSDVKLKHKASIHETTGWLLYQDGEGVSVANEFCPEDETYRGRTFIPASMLNAVTILNLSKKKTPALPKVIKQETDHANDTL